MTNISLHVQWRLTSQLHCSFLKENSCFFITDLTPRQPGANLFIYVQDEKEASPPDRGSDEFGANKKKSKFVALYSNEGQVNWDGP
jgi:hypothetical protein